MSVVVRSMGRPELRLALESVSRQTHPLLDVVVVDATGGGHPPLPAIAWRAGHRLRVVGGDRRLPRPVAANVGLDAIAGEWFCFLDDDDTYDSHHVSALIEASRRHPQALVVYGQTRILNAAGEVEKVFGAPFNRALMYFGPLFYWQASLISRRVIDLGCRFDESMDVSEDRDFVHQVAEHGDFHFEPVVTFNYRPDLGTSGTGHGSNRDVARTVRFEDRLRAKWAGPSTYHTTRVMSWMRRGIDAYLSGDVVGARVAFERVIRTYPDDPNALHALARLELDDGRYDDAQRLVARALEFNPDAAEYHLTCAHALAKLGRIAEARQAAVRALADHRFAEAARQLLQRLPGREVTGTWSMSVARKPTRNGPCRCGSGRRYKDCCGMLAPSLAVAAERPAVDPRGRGEAAASSQATDAPPANLFEDIGLASLRRMAQTLRDRIRARGAGRIEAPSGSGKPQVHLVGRFAADRRNLADALGLAALLAGEAEVILWSVVDEEPNPSVGAAGIRRLRPTRDDVPQGGTLIVLEGDIEIGSWIGLVRGCTRVVLATTSLAEVVAALTHVEENAEITAVDFMHPSQASFEQAGLGGIVHHPPTDRVTG